MTCANVENGWQVPLWQPQEALQIIGELLGPCRVGVCQLPHLHKENGIGKTMDSNSSRLFWIQPRPKQLPFLAVGRQGRFAQFGQHGVKFPLGSGDKVARIAIHVPAPTIQYVVGGERGLVVSLFDAKVIENRNQPVNGMPDGDNQRRTRPILGQQIPRLLSPNVAWILESLENNCVGVGCLSKLLLFDCELMHLADQLFGSLIDQKLCLVIGGSNRNIWRGGAVRCGLEPLKKSGGSTFSKSDYCKIKQELDIRQNLTLFLVEHGNQRFQWW